MVKTTWWSSKLKELKMYFIFRKKFRGMTENEVLDYPTQPGTIIELAQAHALGFFLKDLVALKQLRRLAHRAHNV